MTTTIATVGLTVFLTAVTSLCGRRPAGPPHREGCVRLFAARPHHSCRRCTHWFPRSPHAAFRAGCACPARSRGESPNCAAEARLPHTASLARIRALNRAEYSTAVGRCQPRTDARPTGWTLGPHNRRCAAIARPRLRRGRGATSVLRPPRGPSARRERAPSQVRDSASGAHQAGTPLATESPASLESFASREAPAA